MLKNVPRTNHSSISSQIWKVKFSSRAQCSISKQGWLAGVQGEARKSVVRGKVSREYQLKERTMGNQKTPLICSCGSLERGISLISLFLRWTTGIIMMRSRLRMRNNASKRNKTLYASFPKGIHFKWVIILRCWWSRKGRGSVSWWKSQIIWVRLEPTWPVINQVWVQIRDKISVSAMIRSKWYLHFQVWIQICRWVTFRVARRWQLKMILISRNWQRRDVDRRQMLTLDRNLGPQVWNSSRQLMTQLRPKIT